MRSGSRPTSRRRCRPPRRRAETGMLGYIVQRLLIMIPTLIAISIIVFVIIQLPPGDYFSTYIAELQSQGEAVDLQKIAFLTAQYGFDKSVSALARQSLLRPVVRRPAVSEISARAGGRRKGAPGPVASVEPGHRHRPVGPRGDAAPPARQPARGAAEAICDDGARQGRPAV